MSDSRSIVSLALLVSLLLAAGGANGQYQAAASAESADGVLWLVTSDGVLGLRASDGARHFELTGLPGIRSLATAPGAEILWLATGDGLLAYGGGQARAVALDGGDGDLRLVMVPADESVWLAAGERLHSVSPSGQWLGEARLERPASRMALDAERSLLWIATESRLRALDAYSGAETRVIEIPAELAVRDLEVGIEPGTVWLATDDGLRQYDAGGWLLAEVPAPGATSLAVDGNGGLWVADGDSLVRYDDAGAPARMPWSGDDRIADLVGDPTAPAVWATDGRSVFRIDAAGGGAELPLSGVRAAIRSLFFAPGLPGASLRPTLAVKSGNPPELAIVAPEPFVINQTQPEIAVSYAATGMPLDLASLRVLLDGADLTAGCAVGPDEAICPSPVLDEGRYTIDVEIADTDGLAATASHSFHLLLGDGEHQVTLDAVADTYLPAGPKNRNFGDQPILQLDAGDQESVLTRFDLSAVAPLIDLLLSAHLELYVEGNGDNWGADGRPVNAYRLLTQWSELGATWNCPDDTDLSNNQPDCAVQWAGGQFEPTPTDSVLHTDGLLGWIRYDVAQDVEDVLAGAADDGWILKKQQQGQNGHVDYTAREAVPGQGPKLALVFEGGEPLDDEPPLLAIVSPEDGAFLNDAAPEIVVEYSDAGTGVDTASLALAVDGTARSASCQHGASSATCTLDAPLAEGPVALTATVRDFAGNPSAPAASTFTVDLTPPEIDLESPADGEVTGAPSVTFTGQLSESGTLTLDGLSVSLDAALSFAHGPVALAEGANVFLLAAVDLAGNLTELSVTVHLDTGPTRLSASPAHGEQGVAVTRETILRFSRPLAAGTEVDGSNAFATFGGQTLAARRHVGPDRETVTLFYSEPLPASARVRVTVHGDQLTDAFGLAVDADGDGDPGGTAVIDFDTLTLTVVPGTAVTGRVFASELVLVGGVEEWVNEPLAGVTITVDGLEDTLFAVTDALGDFRLDPAPAGRFFIHVDGKTATNGVPPGAYYPTVGKAWESRPGVETNVGEVYLPLVPADALQPVSATEDTVITFPPSVLADHPDLAVVSLTVPADSLYADDGTRGGQVGIAPVDPERLPGTLPPGLDLPLVITVQTDGATNFDRPAPVCLPNLPDPVTGQVLPPGAPSALASFNHDAGRWEVVGSMTVAADGVRICTDPGVGIRAPGWHATRPGVSAGGGLPAFACDVDVSDPGSVSLYYAFQTVDAAGLPVWLRGTTTALGLPSAAVILAPETAYRYWLVEGTACCAGYADFVTPAAGSTFTLPAVVLEPVVDPDADGDELADDLEQVVGTDPQNPDTDGDGLSDKSELQQGLDPLDGLIQVTGILASADTAGLAADVCASGDVVAVADGVDGGVSVFNVFNGMDPLIVGRIDTPGSAHAVACAGAVVAVADGGAGLALIDVSDPPASAVTHQVDLGNPVRAVALAATTAFAGTDNGHVVAVDVATGAILTQRLMAAGPVQDLFLERDQLYVLEEGMLHVLAVADPPLEELGAVDTPGAVNTVNGRMRLFVGGGVAYVVHTRGYNTIDVADPAQPALIAAGSSVQQLGWKHIVANGSGVGIAALSPNQTFDGPHHVSRYDLSDPTVTDAFRAEFPTPGVARAVAIYNGLAYVADHDAGLQVVNYQSFDVLAVAPAITLDTSFDLGGAEEAKLARVTAQVSDDVQVRNVEFYVDGVRVATDGGFPFEHRFITPRLADQASFTLRARASDTGGNATWNAEVTVPLVADATPPLVVRVEPAAGAPEVDAVVAFFNEPLDPATVSAASFLLFDAGADGDIDTPDDQQVTTGVVSYRSDLNAALLTFAAPLPNQIYRATLTSGITDGSGLALAEDHSWTFVVADAVYWIGGSGNWTDAQNWSGGALPGSADDVVIDVPAAITVTHPAGTTSEIASLRTSNHIVVSGTHIGGTLTVNGTLQTSNQILLSGGTLKNAHLSGSGVLVVTSSLNSRLDGVTADIEVELLPPFNSHLRIANGLTLNGTMTLGGRGHLRFEATPGQIIGGTGEIVHSAGVGNTWFIEGGTTVTLGPQLTVRGGDVDIDGNSATVLVNQGAIVADLPAESLVIGEGLLAVWPQLANQGVMEAAGGTLHLDAPWTNIGTWRSSAGTLIIDGGGATADLGTVVATGGAVELAGTLDNSGQTLTLDAGTGSWTLDGGVVQGGTIASPDGTPLQVSNHADNLFDAVTLDLPVEMLQANASLNVVNGLTVNDTLTLGGRTSLRFNSTPGQVIGGDGEIVLLAGSATNTWWINGGGSTVTFGPQLTVRGGDVAIRSFSAGRLVNQGTILANLAGQRFDIQVPLLNEGVTRAEGGGHFLLRDAVTNHGLFDPGTNPGTATLWDDYIQGPAGVLHLELGGTATAAFGKLDVDGAVVLDGTLELSLLGGFEPDLGDTFRVMTFASSAGGFATVVGQDIGNGKRFDLVFGASDLTLSVVPNP